MSTEADGLSDKTARFEKAVRLLTQMGLESERLARQLLSAGFPKDQVRERFPELAAAVFEAPSHFVSRARVVSASSTLAQGRAPLPQSARDIAAQVAARNARMSAGNSVSTATALSAIPAAPQAAPQCSPANALSEGISFQYVPLIQCSFPHADPGEQRQFTRRNGWLELTLSTARPDTGLPYGVPARLLTIYCASEAIRTRSPEIYLGRSVHDFLRRLDIPVTRGERGSLRVYTNQLLRLIHCALSIDENIRDNAGRTGLHIRQTLFVEEARLWWDENRGVGQGSSLLLSPVLYDSILERSAPLSTMAIRRLRKSPMDLDVYAWLVHRLFHLNKPSSVTWQQLSNQFGHGYGLLRKFRAFFTGSVKRVLEVYPEARLKLTETGVLLLPSRPHVPRDSPTTPR